MAEGDTVIGKPDAAAGSVLRRAQAFLSRLGISELAYAQVIEDAATHASAARPAGPPAGQSWSPVGPRNVCGRILALAQDPNNALTYYAGTAHGGLWRSIDGGDTWEALGSAEHVFPVATIAIAEQDGAVLYIGTGSPHEAYVSGRGLYAVTVPGPRSPAVFRRLVAAPPSGQTPLQANSLAETRGASLRYTRIRIDPEDAKRFWAASQSGLWRCEMHTGNPVFTLEFPAPLDSGETPPPVPSALVNGRYPGYATDLLVTFDARDRATVSEGGPRRYLALHVAVNGAGVYRGRFDRQDGRVHWEKKLGVPVQTPAAAGTGTVSNAASTNPLFDIVTLVPTVGGTRLTRLFRPGDQIEAPPGGAKRQVNTVISDTQLVTGTFPPGALAGTAYQRAAAVPPFAGIRIAACERLPQRLYAVMEQQSSQPTPVYRSDDSGDTWRIAAEVLGPPQGQADYNLVLEVNPTDPDVLTCGLLDVFLSRDGGSTWQQILVWQDYNTIGDYAQHADQHAALFDRFDRRRLWLGNDGGVALSRDLQLPPRSPGYWRSRGHGILAGQFQDVATHPVPALAMFSGGGLQDNGSWVGYGGPTWVHAGWADGGYFGFDPANPRAYLFSQQNAHTTGTVSAASPTSNIVNRILHDLPETLAPGHAMGMTIGVVPAPPGFLLGGAGNSPFVPVLAQDPAAPSQFIFGWRQAGGAAGTDVGAYSSINAGLSAVAPAALTVPSVLVTANADASAATFGPTIGGNAEGWVGFDDGSLIRTGTAPIGPWVAPPAALPLAGVGQGISRVLVHPADERIVVVSTLGAPGSPAPQGQVFISYNRGLNWQDLTGRVPATLTVAPATPSFPAGSKRQFTAGAAFADGTNFDATVRVAWTTSDATKGRFSTNSGEEGQFTALAAGTPTITATLATVGAPAVGTTLVTVTAGAAAPAVLPAPARGFDLLALPPGPITSLALEQVAPPTRLFVGTLAGVYVLNGLPSPTALTLAPPSPLALPLGHTAQLTATLAFSSGAPVAATTEVDWSAAPAGIVNFGVGPLASQVTGAALGATTVTARRGSLTTTLVVNVVAAPPGAPPAAPAAPAPMVAPPVTVNWQPFSAGLPLVLVNGITRSFAAGANLLRIATFGRGVWDINLSAPAVAQNLFIRQTLIEDGRLPRAIPAALPDDPRLPAGAVGLDFTHAFDIRVDAPPYTFFDDRVDGVEFDERLGADTLHPTRPNALYVQVHNNGRSVADGVQLHLYFRVSALAAPIGPPPGVAIPAHAAANNLGPVADFYNPPSFDPAGGGDPVGGTRWTRVGPVRTINALRPGEPVVTRFDWTPPALLAGGNVALLALCSGAAGQDALPALPVAGPGIDTFIPAERRAALRILAVAPLPLPDLYVRGAVDDDGLNRGAATSLLRSPDIIVSPGAPAAAPEIAFRDLLDARPQDHLQAGQANRIYVRVHNRGSAVVHAEVELFAVKVGADLRPDALPANWVRISPAAPAKLELDVPPGSWRLAESSWTPIDPAPGHASFILVALVKSGDNQDPLPAVAGITDEATFRQFLARQSGGDNVVARAVRLRT